MNNILMDKTKLIRTLVNNTPIAYIIMDEENRIHYVNESFLKLRGLEWDKTIGEICYNISNGGKHCEYCAISQAMEDGTRTLLQRKDILPNGTVRYIDDYAIPIFRDPETGLTYLLEIMVNRSEEMQLLQQCNKDLENLVESLVLILQAKDAYTAQHSQNVQKYATKIARALHLSENEVFHISLAALLHDIGKIQIPLDVLNKPSKLTNEEYQLIQSHPEKACDILQGLTDLDDICQMVRHHHERIDGTGYPDKLKEDTLDLGSRILAVADTYDAMTTDRPYRDALSRDVAIAELERVMGTQLDPQIVSAFSSIKDLSTDENEIDDSSHTLLVRKLKNNSVCDLQKELVISLKDIQNKINIDDLMDLIFQNTPCGYVILDNNNTVKYTNDYFLNLFGYDANILLEHTCDLFTPHETDKLRKDCTRMCRKTPDGERIFDLYPISSDDECEDMFHMFAILDRTEEITMRSRLQNDYMRLIEILQELTDHQWDGADLTSQENLISIKTRAEEIAKNYGL